MVLFYLYTLIIFLYVPQNHLNILWVVAAPILVFFFLNRIGGVVMFVSIGAFIVYLMISGHPYTPAEFITLIASFLITSFVMLTYENVKEGEQRLLRHYNRRLQNEVDHKTRDLQQLNATLEQRVRDELEKRLAQEQMLLQQCRMASMGEMIDAIAHQWRQPLMHINAILMNIDRSIETNRHNPTAVIEQVEEMSRLTAYMSTTIEDFRHLFKKNKQTHRFTLRDAIDQALTVMRNRLKHTDITVHDHYDRPVTLNRGEFFQVILILLANALEALQHTNRDDARITLRTQGDDDSLLLTIEDNAGGIADETLPHIFEPYFSTKENQGGSGLGLYIAKIIVEQNMRGTLQASNTSEGACFCVRIPLTSGT